MLVVCRGADEPAGYDAGPPWPLTEDQLVAAAAAAGLTPDLGVCCFSDDENIKRIRALFRRA